MDYEELKKSKWIGDGSDGSTVTVDDDGTVIVKAGELNCVQGLPVNARFGTQPEWKIIKKTDQSSISAMSFTVKVLEMGITFSVGIATVEEFRRGHNIRGMLYNGFVTYNGCRIVNFDVDSKDLRAGDTVGVRVKKCHYNLHNRDKLDVQFFHNGKFLGTAFRLKGENARKTFFPCVQVFEDSTFLYKQNVGALDYHSSPTFEGDWKLETLTKKGTPVNLETGRGPNIMTIFGAPWPKYIGARIGYRMYFFIEKKKGSAATTSPGNVLECKCIDIEWFGSTPPPRVSNVARAFWQAICGLEKIQFEDDALTITGRSEDGDGFLLTAKRHAKLFDPVDNYYGHRTHFGRR
ncbi:MAG: hypothetical protein SGILL_009602 [Bacillariaceae sp.]